jgi:DnaJ-class molecular chaperone
MNGPYPIYGPDDENAQNFPMPGDNPVPQPVTCRRCDGDGGWLDGHPGDWSTSGIGEQVWVRCVECDGHGVVWDE